MGKFVTNGAMLQCSFGSIPTSLVVNVPLRPKCGNMLMATISDMVPGTNIPSFGLCQTISNPAVSQATTAAMGTLTPMPCVPAVTSPWAPGSQMFKVDNTPALTDSCTCQCMWGGIITIKNPGNAAIADVKS